MSRSSTRACALLAIAFAAPAWAHHRKMPEALALTTSGDTALPRVAAQGQKTLALLLQSGSGRQVVTISPFRNPSLQTPQGVAGDIANPSISYNGKRVVWDEATPAGRGLVLSERGVATPLIDDPTATATNPAVDTTALNVAFESIGDLPGTGNPGARQVFVRRPDGSIAQMSTGVGTSRNPVVSAKKHRLAFESTSDPATGDDTGVSQIWLGDLLRGDAAPITSGAASSRNPALSDDGGLLVFESTADLAGNGADTGTSRIYAYDPKSLTFACITDDAGGCTAPGVSQVRRDWRIAFVCGGVPYFYMLRADERFLVQTGGGVTERVLGEMGIHFLVLSTTGNPLGGPVTSGKRVYILNLFKRPAQPVAGLATWFPTRGIPAL